jgi:aminomethyltransferase
MADDALRRTPLHARHVALGAKMVPFGGWSMPVQYDGIVAEHKRCRAAAALFDVSHMGELLVAGGGALEFLQQALTNDFTSLAIGRCRYSLMCNDAGGVVDDVIVYHAAENRYVLVVNASNIDDDVSWLDSLDHRGAEIENQSADFGLLAVQGPRSRDLLVALADADSAARLAGLGYYTFTDATLAGQRTTVSRTGYTGDLGFEVFVPAEHTGELWDRLLADGAAFGLGPAGLGARDTLRLEAGFPLHGHEISLTREPLAAGLGRFVKLDKPAFMGRGVLADIAARGPAERLVGLVATERGVMRDGCAVLSAGTNAGVVTSGSFSPTLDGSIALAYVRADLAEAGTALEVEVRGRPLACAVHALPFWKRAS